MKDNIEIVAVTYDGGGKDIPYFEKTKTFWVYYYVDGKQKKDELLELYPDDGDDLTAQMQKSMIDKIICKNIGPKALAAMRRAGIEVYTFDGAKGAAIRAYRRSELRPL